jgi:MraZ protein
MRGRKWGLVYHFPKFVWDTPNFLIKNDQNDKEAEKMAFISSFMYSLDTKKRILVPNKYRDELGETFYVTRSLDTCLTIYTESEWELFLKGLSELPNTTSAAAKEYFMSAAQKCTPDGSGRILLDDKLIDHARIGKNAVFVGAGNAINIWSEELWAAREASRDLEGIRALLQQHGL